MIQAIAFYLFAFLVIASAVLTIMSRNPVHSVLWLILAFFNAAGLMVLLGAEFIAMLLVVVYVGAVAVLFLFVVMMLDVDMAEMRAGFIKNFPLGIAIALVLLAELVLGIGALNAGALELGTASGENAPSMANSNIENVGALLYSKYIFVFEVAGLILLVAMIGAIVLTLRHRTDVKRQDVVAQMMRDPAMAMELKDVKPGQGLQGK